MIIIAELFPLMTISQGWLRHNNSDNAEKLMPVHDRMSLTAARLGKVVVSAKHCVGDLLGVSGKYKASRLKELFNQLTNEDICEYVLPSLSKWSDRKRGCLGYRGFFLQLR